MTERRYPDMWVDPEDDPREGGSEPTDEKSNYQEYLRIYRLTLRMKCDGLDPEQMARRSVEPSTMSLLGLIRHMAEVERGWFRRVLAGLDAPKLYCTPEDPDADWDGAVADADVIARAWRDWEAEVRFAEEFLAAQTDMGMRVQNRGKDVTLRDVVVHMIEEYARHCGHADLLRERIDGRTGQ
ncbi:putative damage-inducible protein DinB [Stackebrandtia albiflava]|uniref:Putative damage-inducible protein DinB n=1 Tax=Stackebrandtia albiflava TaxID=406432 RepID=A0A562V2V7_9ACTN|nr:DinB family protein [Stackebrandtia albiflava]TWJ12201.1 putative damage-inducible protein DinB [Stackebrandtia albiflava]